MTDPRYDRLSALVGVVESGGSDGARPTGGPQGGEVGEAGGVNVTWLVHDVQVWRVDRIYLQAAGGPWVATQSDLTGSGALWDVEPTWHRPPSPKELDALLGTLGVGSAAASADGARSAATAPTAAAPTAAAPTAAAADLTTATTNGAVAGPLWGAAGFAAGAVLALGAALRRRPGAPGAAQPAPAEPATTDAEVLTSHP